MNHLITYDEAVGFLKNPPLLAPWPNFDKFRALRKHITRGLKQLACPQSAIQGWADLAVDPTRYALLDPTAFFAPPNPGKGLAYPDFAAHTVMKSTDC
jgi:hypothetical protein